MKMFRTPRSSGHPGEVVNRFLLAAGLFAGPLFLLAVLLQDLLRPDYDPLRHPISSHALGGAGWTQGVVFVATGLLCLAFALGVRGRPGPVPDSRWGARALTAWGIGLVGAGLFTGDPVGGYPPGTPDTFTEYSGAPALLHDLFSVLLFLAIPVACLVFARRFATIRDRRRSVGSVIAAVVFLVALVLASAGFEQVVSLADHAGLFQRVALTAAWLWLFLFALYLLRAPEPARSSALCVPAAEE